MVSTPRSSPLIVPKHKPKSLKRKGTEVYHRTVHTLTLGTRSLSERMNERRMIYLSISFLD